MSYIRTTWKDRVVQFANRYKDQNLVQYTFTRDNGTITEAGTEITASRMNNIENALVDLNDGTNFPDHYHDSDRARANHTGTQSGSTISNNTITNDKLVPDIKIGSLASLTTTIKTSIVNAINEITTNFIPTGSFIAFCDSFVTPNTSSLDGAFGKNNESILKFIGKQMAMYGWFTGESKITNPYTNLQTIHTLLLAASTALSRAEIRLSPALLRLISISPYAVSTVTPYISMFGDNINYITPFSSYAAYGTNGSTVQLGTVTITKGGAYRVKYTALAIAGSDIIYLKLNGVVINTSTGSANASIDYFLKTGDILTLESKIITSHLYVPIISTPIQLYSLKPISLPNTPSVGNRVAQLLNETKYIFDTTGNLTNNLTVTKSGTYNINFKTIAYYSNSSGSKDITVTLYKNGVSTGYVLTGNAPSWEISPPLILTGNTSLSLLSGDILKVVLSNGNSTTFAICAGINISCEATDEYPE